MLGETEKSSDYMQNCVIVRDGSRPESGNEFHSDGPDTEKSRSKQGRWQMGHFVRPYIMSLMGPHPLRLLRGTLVPLECNTDEAETTS